MLIFLISFTIKALVKGRLSAYHALSRVVTGVDVEYIRNALSFFQVMLILSISRNFAFFGPGDGRKCTV